MRCLAVIPALNEEASLPAVLRGLRDRWPQVDILVVDDGSTDSTAKVAREEGAIVARLPFNLGIGAALRTGFRYAADQGYDRVFQFDADGQHDADEVAKLFAALDAGADMVVGSRFAEAAGEYEVGATRGTAMGILRATLRLILGRRFTDTSSGFRAFDRPVIQYFSRTYPREYMDSVEALVMAAYQGFHIAEVPVQMHERVAGVASNRSMKLAYNYIRVLAVLVMTVSYRARRAPRRTPELTVR